MVIGFVDLLPDRMLSKRNRKELVGVNVARTYQAISSLDKTT